MSASQQHSPQQREPADRIGDPNNHPELDDNEGADAFETEESAPGARRPGAPERQDEELISLDPPD
ncbi:MAG: hypothetical protein KA158_09150 [Leucobacter sp.]|nr:hypothetical protein [Leucobacter sp.]